jgi:hypothetical protein
MCIPPDKRNDLVREAAQQVPHGVPPVRKGLVSHPEEDVQLMRIPQQQDAPVQLGVEGEGPPHHRNRPDAVHEDPHPKVQERIPGGDRGQEAGGSSEEQLDTICRSAP